MAKPRFGTIGDEAQVLEVIRRMNDDGKLPTQILRALTSAGYTTRSGQPFSRQGVSSIVVDLDRCATRDGSTFDKAVESVEPNLWQRSKRCRRPIHPAR